MIISGETRKVWGDLKPSTQCVSPRTLLASMLVKVPEDAFTEGVVDSGHNASQRYGLHQVLFVVYCFIINIKRHISPGGAAIYSLDEVDG